VYVQAAAIETRPTTINIQVVTIASTNPATAAIPKATKAALFTEEALATPDPTNRNGPTRTASVPFMPSE
jgi:hypothetical protein